MASSSRLRAALAVVGVMLLPLTANSAQKPDPSDRVLPDYDIRLLTPVVPPPLDPQARALVDQLRQERGDLRVRPNPWQPGFRSLSARGGALSGPRAGAPEEIARQFLLRYHALLGLEPADLATLVKTREYRSAGDPLIHVFFKQSVRGVDVFGAALRVHLGQDGTVVEVSNSTTRTGNVPQPRISSADALRAALADIRPELVAAAGIITGPTGASQLTQFAAGPLKTGPEASLVVFPSAGGARLAWKVTIAPGGLPQKYDVLIDAVSGELLYRRNRVRYIEGFGKVLQSDARAAIDARVGDPWPIGTAGAGAADPPGGCPPVANQLTRSLTAPFRDRATVLGGAGRLDGNNVHVFRGAQGVEGAAGALQSDGWHFEYDFGTADAAETHLFFLSNFLHDFFYDLGFDEASGNFQASNLGRGGTAGDALVAIARADGRNNATFEPNPDGQLSVMSMFLWDGQGCWAADVDGDGTEDLDGDLDSDIVIHEFHHGVSNRLNPDFTGIEADAIGEGGSDFFAYSINDNPVLAEYAAPPSGIRQVNNKTYGDFFCLSIFGLVICEPHDNGEVWANTLWDLRERFRADGIGGSDQAAIHAVHQLYVDALKLSPPAPTMLDMRDAILQADAVRQPSGDPGGSVNHCRIWEVFATRGLGAAARDTNDTGTGTTVEDFTVGAECPAPPPPPSVTVTALPSTATEAGPVNGVFHVARSGDTSHALTVYFTVAGSATPGADYVSLPASVAVPAGAASADVIVTPIDDSQVEGNETVVVTLTGSVGYQVGSPATATVTIVSDDVAPDLTVSSITVPFLGGAGASLALSGTVSNVGTGAAPASQVRYFLSTNITVDGSDVVLGSSPVSGLAVGAAAALSATVTVPAGTTTGIYYVLAQVDPDNALNEISENNNVRFGQVRVGPDLSVTAVNAPAIATAGGPITVTDATKNAGGGAAPVSVTRFYLSTNVTFDAADVLMGARSVGALAAGAISNGSTSVVVPAGTATGTYYLFAVSDGAGTITETNESNNALWVTLRVGPDLVIAAQTLTGTPTPGGPLTINDTTKNQGGSASGDSSTRFYLSTDTAFDGADTLLGARAVAALAAGASSAGSTSVTLPAVIPTGTYYVLAVADGAGTNAETNETNNVLATQVRIGPDLIVSITGPSTAAAGGTIAITDTTRNQGSAPAGASSTRFSLSTDTQLSAGDPSLGARAVPGIAQGGTNSGTTTLTLPTGLATGTYYVLAQADGNSEVAETIESNNTSSVLQLRVGPDLAIASVTVTGPLASGGSFSVTDTTKNQGSGTADPSSTRFYFSLNATFDAGDTLLGSRPVATLASGAQQSGSTSLVLPSGLTGGSYYLLAVADGDGTVAETSESNNVWPAVIKVGPDLTIASLIVPRQAASGATISVTDQTKNLGAPAGSSTTAFYLTTDFVLDASDVLLGTRTVGALGSNATSTGTTTVTLPGGLPAGNYYIVAVADSTAAISEAVETNNTVFSSVSITSP
jgi:subtilase family serine protease